MAHLAGRQNSVLYQYKGWILLGCTAFISLGTLIQFWPEERQITLEKFTVGCASYEGELDTRLRGTIGGVMVVPVLGDCWTPVLIRPRSGSWYRPDNWIERQELLEDGTTTNQVLDGPELRPASDTEKVVGFRYRNTGERTGGKPVQIVIR